MNELNIDAVVLPLIEDELEQIRDEEKRLYNLTPDQIKAYLEFASYYNEATRIKKAAKKLIQKGEALKTLFWMDVKDSSEIVERTEDIEGLTLRVRFDGVDPIIVQSKEEGSSHGLPDFLRNLLDR